MPTGFASPAVRPVGALFGLVAPPPAPPLPVRPAYLVGAEPMATVILLDFEARGILVEDTIPPPGGPRTLFEHGIADDQDGFGSQVVVPVNPVGAVITQVGFSNLPDAFGTQLASVGARVITQAGHIEAPDAFGSQGVGRGVINQTGHTEGADGFGAQTVLPGARTVTQAGHSDLPDAFGTNVAGGRVVFQAGITSDADAFGNQATAPVPWIVTQTGIANDTDSFGAHQVAGRLVTQAGHTESADSFGVQSVARGAVSVTQAGLTGDADAFGTNVVGSGGGGAQAWPTTNRVVLLDVSDTANRTLRTDGAVQRVERVQDPTSTTRAITNLTNATTPLHETKLGRGVMTFDGTDDFMEMTADLRAQFGTISGPRTLHMVVFAPTSMAGWAALLQVANPGQQTPQLTYALTDTGTLYKAAILANWAGFGETLTSTAPSWTAAQATLLTWRVNADNSVDTFVNGTLQTDDGGTMPAGTIDTTNMVGAIGADAGGGGGWFPGSIGAVIMYSTAQTDTEISTMVTVKNSRYA